MKNQTGFAIENELPPVLILKQGKTGARLSASIFCHIPEEVRQSNIDKVDIQAFFPAAVL